MATKTLSNAKKAKADEFFTQLADIENELKHYKEHFKNKVVFCNCDDPYESNFFKYFAMNFNFLGIKKLIATCFDSSPIAYTQLSFIGKDRTTQNKNRRAYKIEICEVEDYNGDGAVDLSDVEYLLHNKENTLTLLKGDGDFRSEECVELLKEADIVVTNPPFSLFREYIAQLVEYNKKFIIIGNQNAITYKEVFKLFKENKIWLGYKCGDMKFTVPSYYEERTTRFWIDEKGQKWRSFGNICWYTNVDIAKRHEELTLYKHYYGHEDEYPKYDNYDAINVDKVADIPCDYFEDMGVPITYLDKYNSDQFEIVKFRKGNDEKDLTYTTGSATILTERNGTERNGTPNYALFPNCHQAQSVEGLSACRLHSSTNITLNNLKLSDLTDMSQTTQDMDIDLQLKEKKSMQEFSLKKCCNGIMGVPITFLDKYNPEQFEILGLDDHRVEWRGRGPDLNGKSLYRRIIVRRKCNEN